MEECHFGLSCKGNYIVTQKETLNLLGFKNAFQFTTTQFTTVQAKVYI